MSDLNVGIVPKKDGRKVVGFVMGWNLKDVPGKIEATKERNRHRAGRKSRSEGTHEVLVDRNASDVLESDDQ
jgi:hypothetical protein